MKPWISRPGRHKPSKGKAKRRRSLRRRHVLSSQPPQPEYTVDRDLFETFKPTYADTQAIGPASIHHWTRYKWHATPLKHAPWGPGRLRLWLDVEATQSYGKLPPPERRIFFAWWRWKHQVPRRVKRVHDGNVFYKDEIGRVRVFWA